VVSETDVEVALDHLRKLPFRARSPVSWDRRRLLNDLRQALGPRPEVNQCLSVGPGLFAIVKPFGVDLVSHGELQYEGRLQVWLLIRPCGTDPARITEL